MRLKSHFIGTKQKYKNNLQKQLSTNTLLFKSKGGEFNLQSIWGQ